VLGSAGAGQLGSATGVVEGVYSYAVTVLTAMTKVAVGPFNVCAIDLVGDVECWGSNVSGELGHDPASDPIPQCPDTNTPCNPNPSFVHLADGGTFDHATSVAISLGNGFTTLPAAGYACALKDGVTVWCWGGNTGAELGNGAGGPDAGPSFTPVQVVGLP